MPEEQDQLYDSYSKNLYRVGDNDLITRMLRPQQGSNSSGLGEESHVNYSTTVQAVGSQQSGKKSFDNTIPGYILGFDPKDGFAKFFIGNSSDYLNWDGASLVISGTFIIGSKIITVTDIADLQPALDSLSVDGGTVTLAPGTYMATATITIPSGVTLNGDGAIIDFGGGAFQVLIQGTNAYATGTLSVNYGSTSVTGAGTTWTSAMIGQSILIGDYWYTISAVGGVGALTLSTAFIGTNLAGDTYVIATTIDGVTLSGITLTNSSTTLLRFRYANGLNMNTVTFTNGGQGVDGDDSANVNLTGGYTIYNCIVGLTYDNVPFCVLESGLVNVITGGTGMAFTRVTNTALNSLSIQGVIGKGATFVNCTNFGFEAFSIIQCTSHGLELISGTNDMDFLDGYINTCGGDGYKITATSDRNTIVATSILNNTGYGINIAAASCDYNNIVSIAFSGNGSGTYIDNGTSTQIIQAGAQAPDVQEFTTSGAHTWTKPVGARNIIITFIGAGAGGTGGDGAGNGSGGGGGSINSWAVVPSLVTPTVSITVGAAGTAGAFNGAGTDGGDTSATFGSALSAGGGKKGVNGSGGRAGGAGGTSSGGISGGAGQAGTVSGTRDDGAFGGGAGANATTRTAGTTDTNLGNGGVGAVSGVSNATAGSIYGGGGAGGSTNNLQTSSAGAVGYARVVTYL